MTSALTDLRSTLDRAKSGEISRAEVEEVANALRAGSDEHDVYTLLHIVGRAGGPRFEHLVAGFLNHSDDPMIARLALQILGVHWGLGSRYTSEILRFLEGVEWDTDEDVRLAAISSAGEVVRSGSDRHLLRALVRIGTDISELDLMREAAIAGIARAIGYRYDQIPPPTRRERPDSDWSTEVLDQARTMLNDEPKE